MNYYFWSGVINAATSFFVAALIFISNRRVRVNQIFIIFATSVGLWAFGYSAWNWNMVYGIRSSALFWIRFAMLGSIVIPPAFTEFVIYLLHHNQKWKKLRILNISIMIFVICLSFSHYFIKDVYQIMNFQYWPVAGPLFYVFHLWFGINVTISQLLLIESLWKTKGSIEWKRNFSVFIGTFVGFVGGMTNHFLWYGIKIPPVGNILVAVYVATVAFSIIRYKFLDIEIIIKRTLVFAGLFGILLLIAGFVTAITQSYIGQLIGFNPVTSNILTVLIVMLLFGRTQKLLVNLTDKFLFQKKYDYHKLLKDASRGMSNIESLEHLLGLVVHFVTMKMRVKNAAVLMRTESVLHFNLVYQRGYEKKYLSLNLDSEDPLILFLSTHKEAVDIERIKEQIETTAYQKKKIKPFHNYEAIRDRMIQLQTSCCIPSFLGRELRNVLLLGEKKSGEYYSTEDLNLLYTLAQESAIAIENARLYDEALKKSHQLEQINQQLEYSKELLVKALQEAEGANKQLQDTQAQLIHEQKMATLGRLAASVGHEVNNPLTILSMNVSRAILKYRKNPETKISEILDVFDKIEKNIERIKAVVNTLTGLLKKSEKGKFEPLSLKLILEETLPLVQFQTYLDNLTGTEVVFNVPGSIPLIRGDLERLQEVFLNLFINAYHAMATKRFRKIAVFAEIDPKDPKMIAVHFKDNGSGMTEEVMKKIFNYGFTTKPPGKGSGLGLYMCKYIIELHGGTITVQSKVGEGTTFTLTLPVYEESQTLKNIPPQPAAG